MRPLDCQQVRSQLALMIQLKGGSACEGVRGTGKNGLRHSEESKQAGDQCHAAVRGCPCSDTLANGVR